MTEISVTGRSGFRRGLEWVIKASAAVGAISTLILMIHVVLDVAGRYLFNAPLPGTIEFVSYWWMILIIFTPLAYTQMRREHIDVSVFVELMPPTHRALTIAATRLLTLFGIGLVGWYGFFYAIEQMQRGEEARGAVHLWIWPFRFLVPWGMALFALQLLADFVDDLKHLKTVWRA